MRWILPILLVCTYLAQASAESVDRCKDQPPVISGNFRFINWVDPKGELCFKTINEYSPTTGKIVSVKTLNKANGLLRTNFYDTTIAWRVVSSLTYNPNQPGVPTIRAEFFYSNCEDEDHTSVSCIEQNYYRDLTPESQGWLYAKRIVKKNKLRLIEGYKKGPQGQVLLDTRTHVIWSGPNSETSTATTYNAQNKRIKTVKTEPLSKRWQGIEISDYLSAKTPKVTTKQFIPGTNTLLSYMAQIKTTFGAVRKEFIYDPNGEHALLQTRYYDPYNPRLYSTVDETVESPKLCHGYSPFHSYDEGKMRMMRNTLIQLNQVYSDLATRTDFFMNWCSYVPPIPPGEPNGFLVDYERIFRGEILVAAAKQQEKPDTTVDILLGDSITAFRQPGYPMPKPNQIILTMGRGGDNIEYIAGRLGILTDRINAPVSPVRVSHVFIMGGVNNLGQNEMELPVVGTPNFSSNPMLIAQSNTVAVTLLQMAKAIYAKDPNIHIHILPLTPIGPAPLKSNGSLHPILRNEHVVFMNGRIQEEVAKLTDANEKTHITLDDLVSPLKDASGRADIRYFTVDQLHPNLLGHKVIADGMKKLW